MSHDFSLDARYRIHPRIVLSIKSTDSIAVFGQGLALELSLALFQALMAFADAGSAREVYQALDVDVDLEQFGRIVRDFAERGLLEREPGLEDEPGLHQLLNPRIFSDAARVDQIGGWMRQGRAIIIPDALPADLAEEVHRDLDRSSHWTVGEGGHDFFHYRNSVINQLEGTSPALTRCSRLFRSAATRRFIAELSGEDCAGQVDAGAAWYRPYEYALPHDDSSNGLSSVAYIWYLAKDWRPEWGGALFWCPTGQYIRPGFNVLVLFRAMPSSLHLVCPVAPTATEKRLTINGFWNRSTRRPPPAPVPPDARVSPPVYGARAPGSEEASPLIVL